MVATLDHTPMTFDGLTDGSTFANSDGLIVNGTAPIVKASAAMHGDRGINWTGGTAGRVMFDYGSNQTARSIMLSFYFRINAWATSANMSLAAVQSLQTSGVQQGDWRIDNATKKVTIRNGTSAAVTSAVALSLATIYRAEWKVTDSTNTQQLQIFQGEDTTTFLDITSTGWTLTANRVFFIGPFTAAAGLDVDYDTIRIADDFVGPYVTSTPNPTSGLLALM